MEALLFTQDMQLDVAEIDKPIAKNNQALIKVEAAGICGSDMHAWHGHDARRRPPLVLGHEVSGTIIAGKNIGQKVTLNPRMVCGQCHSCLTNRENICENFAMIGMTHQGGFAEYLTIKEECLIPTHQSCEPLISVLCEPTAVCLHGVRLAEKLSFTKDFRQQKILIIGGGAIGLITALILQHFACDNISICDNNALRVNTLEQTTQCKVINNSIRPIQENYDIIFDAVGSPRTRELAIKQINRGGIIAHLGLQQNGGDFDARKFTIEEIIFTGVFTYTHQEMIDALKLLEDKQLGDVSKWCEVRPLSAGQKAFEDIHNNNSKAAKIILIP